MPMELIYPGKFRGNRGGVFEFSESDLQAAVNAYDPELYKAPIVLGHPKTDDPSMGWIAGLEWDKDNKKMIANASQVQPAFAEVVKEGGFKKVSAAFYLPDDPYNPTPGTLYLRHVGFLGATPPAVKGLKDAVFNPEEIAPAFSEDGDFVFIDEKISRLEFAEVEISHWDLNYHFKTVGRLIRNIKNKFIEAYGQDETDKLLPEYDLETVITDVETINNQPEAIPAFGEKNKKEETMTEHEKELEKQIADLQKERDDALKKVELAEEKVAKEAEKILEASVASFAESWAKEGRIDMKAKDKVAANLLALVKVSPEFSESDFDLSKKAAEFAETLAPVGTFKTHSKETYKKENAKEVKILEFSEEADAEFAEEVENYAKEHNIPYDEATEKVLESKQ